MRKLYEFQVILGYTFTFQMLPYTMIWEWLLRWCSGKESTCQCRRCWRPGFYPWVRKIPWRKWQPTPVCLPGKFHGQRSLADQSWGHKDLGIIVQIGSFMEQALLCSRHCTKRFTGCFPSVVHRSTAATSPESSMERHSSAPPQTCSLRMPTGMSSPSPCVQQSLRSMAFTFHFEVLTAVLQVQRHHCVGSQSQ